MYGHPLVEPPARRLVDDKRTCSHRCSGHRCTGNGREGDDIDAAIAAVVVAVVSKIKVGP